MEFRTPTFSLLVNFKPVTLNAKAISIAVKVKNNDLKKLV